MNAYQFFYHEFYVNLNFLIGNYPIKTVLSSVIEIFFLATKFLDSRFTNKFFNNT